MTKLICLIGRKQINCYIGTVLITAAFYTVKPSFESYATAIAALLVGTSALNVAEDVNKNNTINKEENNVSILNK